MFIIYKRTLSKAIHWENQCHEGRKLLTSSSWPSFARLRCNGHPAFFCVRWMGIYPGNIWGSMIYIYMIYDIYIYKNDTCIYLYIYLFIYLLIYLLFVCVDMSLSFNKYTYHT
jgi:hypothetical protein